MISIFLNRVFRAIKIDVDLYEEVEKDKSATVQAGTVVVLSSLAAGVGALQLGASNFLLAPVLSLLSWYVWAYVIYFVGVKLFGGPKTKSNHGELLRTIGFSSAPGLIRVFGVTPDLMTVTFIGSAFWMLACMKNSSTNSWFWKPNLQKILKKAVPKTMYFFACVFQWILERFGEGFGRVWGRGCRLLAPFGALFGLFF